MSPLASSMVAPSLAAIGNEFNIDNEVELQLVLSVFVLAYAVGPLIMGPLSELYGRASVLLLSNMFFLVFNTACGAAHNKASIIVFRFLAGVGGSAPLVIGGGTIGDLFAPDQRGKAMSLWTLAPVLGPAIGPLAGSFITQGLGWRWVFYVTSIADALIQALSALLLQETYAPSILRNRRIKRTKVTGNSQLHTPYDEGSIGFGKQLRKNLKRPVKLLATQPIVQLLALYMAYLYGLIYIAFSSFPALWENIYREPVGIAGLNYLSLGVGYLIGSQVCAPLDHLIYQRLSQHRTGRPEFRIPLMIPSAILVPIGLFWYGWSAKAETHWIIPDIGAAVFAAGVIMGFQCIQMYLVDAYTRYAASAIAAVTVIRSLAGFGFPLFAPAMYAALDYGWGNSVLAFVALAVGIPAPALLWRYGEKLRAKSTFAAGAE